MTRLLLVLTLASCQPATLAPAEVDTAALCASRDYGERLAEVEMLAALGRAAR